MTQKIRVVTRDGNFFDMDKPDNWTLPGYVSSVRATGCILNEQIYVPHDFISCIFTFDTDAPPATMSKPVGTTMQ
jgi:hypothetical protein